jgi:hypothetical protein
LLARTVFWPTRGNHDVFPAYLQSFSFPTDGIAGGEASDTEDFFSFDHANVHFICLNSFELIDASEGGPMWDWVEEDLEATDQEWIIAYWHHPPFSRGSHDSDTDPKMIQMRLTYLPLLEDHGVDLVLGGHSHGYERSFLVDGHYTFGFLFDEDEMLVDGGDGRLDSDGAYTKPKGSHGGTVYIVAGSSGKTAGGDFDHPVMFHSERILGSLVIDVEDLRMDVTFIDDTGATVDYFTLLHESSEFLRGDANASGVVDLLDSLALLEHLFLPGSSAPSCLDSADFDDSGTLGLLDAIGVLQHLFVDGSATPADPFPSCGLDVSADGLGCSEYPECP